MQQPQQQHSPDSVLCGGASTCPNYEKNPWLKAMRLRTILPVYAAMGTEDASARREA